MPTLSLTVDAAVAARVQAAYGAKSLAELTTMVIADIKSKVKSHESQIALEIEQAKIDAAQQALNIAVSDSLQKVESEIVIA